MAVQPDRANWCCPSCDSSDVFREGGKIFECRFCGKRIHEGILENGDSLEQLINRDDKVGAFAKRLLETGGVVSE